MGNFAVSSHLMSMADMKENHKAQGGTGHQNEPDIKASDAEGKQAQPAGTGC